MYLILNVFIWAFSFMIYYRKKRQIDAGAVLILSYFLYAISSYIYFNTTTQYNELSLFPFIYLILVILVFMHPVLKYDYSKIVHIQKPNMFMFYSIIYIYIYSSLINFALNISDIYNGIFTIINDPMGGLEIYKDTMDNSLDVGDGIISNVFALFSNIFSDVGILLFFYYLTFKNKNRYLLIAFVISIMASIFAPIAESQRGPAVDRLLTVIIAYFALDKYMPILIKRRIRKVGVLLLFLFAIPIVAITVSRFGERDDRAKESVFEYVGMQNIKFNNYAFDNGGLRYGDRTFPLFKRMMGYENVPYNFWERRMKYPNLKINDEVFIGFVGDFVLDFGPVITAIIFAIFTITATLKTKIRYNTLLFHQLIILYFIMCVCIQGGIKLYSFSDTGGNLRFLFFILVYFAFKIDYLYRFKNHRLK